MHRYSHSRTIDLRSRTRPWDQLPQARDSRDRRQPPPGLLPKTPAAQRQMQGYNQLEALEIAYSSPLDSDFDGDRHSSNRIASRDDFSSPLALPQTPPTDYEYSTSAENSSKSQTYLDPMATAFTPNSPTPSYKTIGHQTNEFPLPAGYKNYHQWHQINAHPILMPEAIWGPSDNASDHDLKPLSSANKRLCTSRARDRESTPPGVGFEDDEEFLPASMMGSSSPKLVTRGPPPGIAQASKAPPLWETLEEMSSVASTSTYWAGH